MRQNKFSIKNNKVQRLAKLISNAGVYSRRDTEKLILDGQVKVDGITVTSPATNVNIDNQIEVSGSLITSAQKSRLWIYTTSLLVSLLLIKIHYLVKLYSNN